MNRILKRNSQAAGSDVLSLSVALGGAVPQRTREAEPAVDPEVQKLLDERAALLERLEKQEAELAGLRKQVRTAFQEGEAEGREAGRRAAEDAGAAMLTRLEGGIRQAAGVFATAVSGLERLAPALAREGLAAVLGAEKGRAALVSAIVTQHLRTLEAHSILQIEVSQSDFGDEAALSALTQALGASGLRIVALAGLKSGECRIQLKLGTLDVGIDQQWGRLGALLEQMSQPVGARHD